MSLTVDGRPKCKKKICPSISCCLSGSQCQQTVPRRTFLQLHLPSPPVGLWGVSRPDGICSPSSIFLGLLSIWLTWLLASPTSLPHVLAPPNGYARETCEEETQGWRGQLLMTHSVSSVKCVEIIKQKNKTSWPQKKESWGDQSRSSKRTKRVCTSELIRLFLSVFNVKLKYRGLKCTEVQGCFLHCEIVLQFHC